MKSSLIMFAIKLIKTHFIFILILGLYILFSFLTYTQYGPTGDEWAENRAAHDLALFLKQPTTYDVIVDDDYHDAINFDYGHHPLVTKYQRSYQLVQYLINYKNYYEWGHLINLLFGSLFFIISYVLFYFYYKQPYKSLIPVLLLMLTPRLIGHIPGNNKDMPFAVMYLGSLGLIYFVNKYKINIYWKIILLGLAFGITQTFRSIGFSIYFIYVIYWIYLNWINNKKYNLKEFGNFFLELFIIGIFSLFISVSIFPWLGMNFFMNFYEMMLNSKSFQNWDDTIFFNGQFLMKGERPWYYLFTWIAITTPISILILSISSILFIKKLKYNNLYVLLAISFIVNIILYLILQPVIYNGLRHFLYLLPIIVLISSITLILLLESFKNKVYKWIVIVIISFNLLSVGWNMGQLHPYEYLYFNELVGGLHGANEKYEMDYWGATYKEATQWLINNKDLSHEDVVYGCNVDYAVDYYSEKVFFMTYGFPENANYIICDIENLNKGNFEGEVIYEVKRQGVTLNKILKTEPLKKEE